jgi:hypothetical protein
MLQPAVPILTLMPAAYAGPVLACSLAGEGHLMRRFPFDTDEDPARTPSQTESSEERGFSDSDSPQDLGEVDEFDDDEQGDIADETPGHRG